MDPFWMPVVEPYAISEAWSTAGKINMNYQMVPFNQYIRRATGMHAVLKGEVMGAFPTQDALYYKNNPVQPNGSGGSYQAGPPVIYPTPDKSAYGYPKWSAYGSTSNGLAYSPQQKYWYRRIEPDVVFLTQGTLYSQTVKGTLQQFDARFEFDSSVVGTPYVPYASYGLFRTASQICEVFLLPKKIQGSTPPNPQYSPNAPTYGATDGSDMNSGTPYTPADMAGFWQARGITGDNTKERPYANIYGKITTQSNTFRVHYRVQTLGKARSTDPTIFNSTQDSVTSEYRGSALIERRLDPTTLPGGTDYATPNLAAMPNLSNFYSFRVLEDKRFLP
jgi:uncharacterized protein (TIGR02600 family)